MSEAFLAAIANRRTYYGLSKDMPISPDKVQEIVSTCIKFVPSSFNMQGARVVLVTGEANTKLWANVNTEYAKTLGGDEKAIAMYDQKIKEYAAGYGTVVFFEDESAVQGMAAKIPGLATVLPTWATTSSGMLQFAVWTALEAEGLGANLQHYGQYGAEIQAAIKTACGAAPSWNFEAMMPFGGRVGEPGQAGREKTFMALEERLQIVS